MTSFGGIGGIPAGRELDQSDLFEMAVKRCLGERLKNDDDLCAEMWSALANMDWKHDDGDTASYSFRAAGDLIAAVRGEGDYLDWYCSGPSGVVTVRIAEALSREGWHPD